jgi:hypothetical protein
MSRKALITITIAVSAIAVSPVWAEVGTNGPPAVAEVHIRFPDPLRLAPTMIGQIKAVDPGRFQGHARFYIGKRMVAEQALSGKLRTRWSQLRVSPSSAARHKVVKEARRVHRRPVLEIGVKYWLRGRKHFRTRLRRFIVTLPR